MHVIANNRQVYHEYFVDETFEAGMVLWGTEIKAIRGGHVSLREAYVRIERGEAWLVGCHIAPYDHGNRYNHESTRTRKLLLHRKELLYLGRKVKVAGLTLAPIRLYIKDDLAKLEIGVCRGKKLYDKRESIGKREAQREMARALVHRSR